MAIDSKVKKRLMTHLEKYMTDTLKISDPYTINGTVYHHILPDDKKIKNIIDDDYNKSLIANIKAGDIHLHKDFGHLNSSQAMCLNLFNPLIESNLFSFFEVEDKEEAVFEKVIYDSTNLDFFVKGKTKEINVEVKYTEDAGSGNPDQERIDNIYRANLDKLSAGKKTITDDLFSKKYQLFRNMILALTPNSYCYFVYPKFRKDLDDEINGVLKNYVNEDYHNRIKILHVDDIVDSILEGDYDQKLKDYYKEFKKKYLDF